jgi:hypothetical protein
MRMHAQRQLLDDGRWHFQHGPIDIVLQLAGEPQACADAAAALLLLLAAGATCLVRCLRYTMLSSAVCFLKQNFGTNWRGSLVLQGPWVA